LEGQKLSSIESKVLSKINGATLEKGGWRIKHNYELQVLHNALEIVTNVSLWGLS
jgi:hypothetical protein